MCFPCCSKYECIIGVLSAFCKSRRYICCTQRTRCSKEVEQSQKAIQLLGGELIEIKQIEIPHTDLEHKIVLIKKIVQTPAKYPRKAGKPVKSPIQ